MTGQINMAKLYSHGERNKRSPCLEPLVKKSRV